MAKIGKKVLVAMSGGVDSSVAAFLLKENGYDVTGITMCLGVKTTDEKARCCGSEAVEDAKKVCYKLGIPHHVMDFSGALEDKIISKFVSEYLKGRTPNPCVDCNRHLKFGSLLSKARAMGFDFLATGHYARIEKGREGFVIKKAADRKKDQSYFLYSIDKELLEFILFPVGELTKGEVREIARKAGLAVAGKKESQDICFILDGDYRTFVSGRSSEAKPGNIVDLQGNILGRHEGIFSYTVGQRGGLGITTKEPFYVLSIDSVENKVIVGEKKSLSARGLVASGLNIFTDNLPERASAKIRYTPRESECSIAKKNDNLEVMFDNTEEAITPGQSVVLYENDTVLGGGIIEKVLW